ncbi:unnamed protein product [Chilo suppressalis]|uniref:Uncharacterized protein n=1 Tax=Chilo suppressalis TaxID=168631 RepID=A0ABN8B060_CHISP|nr:unnamed protein product [Chilo suppressalis]
MLDFLDVSFRSLEALNATQHKEVVTRQPSIRSFKADIEVICSFCLKDHYIYNCKEFVKLSPEERRDVVQEKQLCFNCLVPGIYAQIIKEGLKRYGSVIAQNSHHGWFISGKVEECVCSVLYTETREVVLMNSQHETDKTIGRFWKSEELHPKNRKKTARETECEEKPKRRHSLTDGVRSILKCMAHCSEYQSLLLSNVCCKLYKPLEE